MAHDEIISPRPDSDDGRLLSELRRVAAQVDSVPEVVLAAARAAIITRDLDAELAVLVGDSMASAGFDPVRAAPEAPAGNRVLSFTGGGVQVDLEVTEYGDQVTLIGQLTGAAPEGCVLEYANGRSHQLELDALGRFLARAEPGPLRVRCRSTDGTRVTTAWVTV
jgi:hypothetical protein